CAKINVERLEIPAGERRTVATTLDLTRHRPSVVTEAFWHDRFPLRAEWIDGSGKKARASWAIRGNVRALIAAEPAFIWFGDGLIRGSAGKTHRLTIRPQTPLNDLMVASTPDGFECSLKRASHGYELAVTPTDKLPPGFISRELK